MSSHRGGQWLLLTLSRLSSGLACHSLLRAPTVRRVAWQFEAAYTIALKPKRWRFGRRSGGERIAAFAMKHIQPFRSRLLDTVPIHYFLAFRAIGVRNYR